MNRFSIITVCFIAFITSCKTPEARKPIQHTSGSSINYSIEKNKKMIANEEADFLQIIEKDTANTYMVSKQGFWYYYNTQNPQDTTTAAFGDLVEFEYNIKDLNGNTIYTKEQIGAQTYTIDKEELISGLRDALKILKENETATFLFPSHKAYGYYGDLNKIGVNMPLISTVTLLKIKQLN